MKIIKLPLMTKKQWEEIKNKYNKNFDFQFRSDRKNYSERRTGYWGSGEEKA